MRAEPGAPSPPPRLALYIPSVWLFLSCVLLQQSWGLVSTLCLSSVRCSGKVIRPKARMLGAADF